MAANVPACVTLAFHLVELGMIALLSAAGPLTARAQPANQGWVPRPVGHVIHISLDGLNAGYLFGYVNSAPAEFPTFTRLKAEGAYTFNARCDFDSSITQPNHASMLTGRPVLAQPAHVLFSAPHGYTRDIDPGPPATLHTLGNPSVPYKASVLDVVHDQGLGTAFFSGKQKFRLFLRSYDGTNGAPDLTGADNGRGKIDQSLILDATSTLTAQQQSSNLANSVVATLGSLAPAYLFLHFADPDTFGHATSWGSPAYSNAVRHLDRQIGRILDAVEANPFLSNQTAVIVTTDHGGGSPTNSHTAAAELANFKIPFFLWGPGVPAGTNLYSLLSNRTYPGTNRLDFNAPQQPLRNGDSGNMALALLGLPPIPGSTLAPQFGTPAAVLLVERSAAGLTLSWPAWVPGYELQSAEACDASARWQSISQGIVTNDSLAFYSAPNVPGTRMRFYRLHKLSQ